MAEGIIAQIIELWEIALPVILFLLIGSAILFISDTDLIKSKTLNNEISYIAAIKGNKNYEISIELTDPEEIKISSIENQITLDINGKESTNEYIGTNINFEKKENKIILS